MVEQSNDDSELIATLNEFRELFKAVSGNDLAVDKD